MDLELVVTDMAGKLESNERQTNIVGFSLFFGLVDRQI